jgi:pimeloyl-ACP methyl ester carboxylesterase
VDFGGNRLRQLGEQGIDEWRRAGALRVFHYGENRERMIRFDLYEDAAAYDAFAVNLRMPVLVLQGEHDDAVEPASVLRWAAPRSNVTVRLLDDGHQLAESIELIWSESARFLGLS